jgi:lysophospholipase L1-like esterase
MTKIFISICTLFFFQSNGRAAETYAVIGDSISTGAVTHPDLSFDATKLWNIFRGQAPFTANAAFLESIGVSGMIDPLAPPVRLPPSRREFLSGPEWFGKNLLNTFSQLYLDTPQYSWSYLLAKKTGVEPTNILIAAEDGARMKAALPQVERLLEKTGGDLPNKVFFFFTGNDLCGPNMDFVTPSETYAGELQSALEYLKHNGQAPSSGTDVYVLSFLSLLQVSGDPGILAKTINAHGKQMTCKEVANYKKDFYVDEALIKSQPEAFYFFKVFPKSPAGLCATVFEKNIDFSPQQRITLANRIRSYRDLSKQTVDAMNAMPNQPGNEVRFHFISETANLAFAPEDLAEDCFHLSARGQKRLSETVFDSMAKAIN